MRRFSVIILFFCALLSSCGEYNKVMKSTDYEYRYEAAKSYYALGQYSRAASILTDLINIMKGTSVAEECMHMLGMSYYHDKDYEMASMTFQQYINFYPRGTYAELARFYSGKALYLDSPEPRLDQSGTYKAIQELQTFMEYFPSSSHKEEAQTMIFALQDKLVRKEYLTAKLYYNMGNYLGNNFLACVITAQNALKEYPYTELREELSILVLRAKNEMAINSVVERQGERYRETVDEYYAFKNEFPESKYLNEAEKIFKDAQKALEKNNYTEEEE
ncbi:MAG: outer membrane protein assembly factor BamD [Bacteroidales bacterium]|nr:outer membrane protein assembly factor BamD [Bacteroidales bacterium]